MSASKRSAAGRGVRMLYCIGAAAFLVYCCIVQLNDPDPVRWIVAYGAGAVLCLTSVRIRWPAWLVVGLSAVALGAALTVYAQTLHSGAPITDWLGDEVGREVMGLVLLCALCGGLLWARPEDS